MTDKDIKKFAELVLKVGINIYKGQKVRIRTGAASYEFALVLSECAYQHGAGYVEIDIVSNRLAKSRITYGPEDSLTYLPHYHGNKFNEITADNWANISIDNTEELDVLKDIDAEKVGALVKTYNETRKLFVDSMMLDKSQWCVINYPGPKWAAKVFGTEESEQTTAELWKSLKKILRLDTPDPVEAWKEHGKNLVTRREVLNKMKLDKLIFTGEGTDLEIGLSPFSIWGGGPSVTPEGRQFLANIPTEEIYSSPDYRRTSGKVRVTKPVTVMETLVKEAWFEFKEGKVVSFGASEGKDSLAKYLSIDEGASFLGEVALVDAGSPIYKSGLLFNSILLDENASSHIALGCAYPSCFSNGNRLKTDEDKKAAGCNTSLVHTDFMIGSPGLTVTGVDTDNKKIPIIKDGIFLI